MNVIIYVLDALRADHVSVYGYHRKTTPNIDRLAEEGVLFANCFSPSTWTRPVAASILTGVYPPVHNVRTRKDMFSSDIPRLPEILQKQGYRTVAFSAMGNVSSVSGFNRGFEQYFDLYKVPSLVNKRPVTTSREEELLEDDIKVAIPLAEDINDFFFSWLERTGKFEPGFFAFIWSIDPHIPYEPPPTFRMFVNDKYRGKVDGSRESLRLVKNEEDLQHLINLYDSEIYYNDWCIGNLTRKLHELNIYDDTMLIVASDHGDAFKEHGWLVHGNLPYDELIHVPLIVKFPKSRYSGEVVDSLVQLIDIFPSLLEIAGIEYNEGYLQGKSFLPLIKGHEKEVHNQVLSETQTWDMRDSFYSVRTRNWKYIKIDKPKRNLKNLKFLWNYIRERNLIKDLILHPLYFLNRYNQGEKEMLFNLQEDPGEKSNMKAIHPQKTQQFSNMLDTWLEESKALAEQFTLQKVDGFDDETREHLRGLGYID